MTVLSSVWGTPLPLSLYNLLIQFVYMPKVFRGFRFDLEIYTKFKELAAQCNLGVTEALEGFMKACVRIQEIKFPEPADSVRDVEVEARILLAWLRKENYWYSIDSKTQMYVPGRLLQLLPKIENETLRREVEEQLKKI